MTYREASSLTLNNPIMLEPARGHCGTNCCFLNEETDIFIYCNEAAFVSHWRHTHFYHFNALMRVEVYFLFEKIFNPVSFQINGNVKLIVKINITEVFKEIIKKN